jgi:hypothetical protein
MLLGSFLLTSPSTNDPPDQSRESTAPTVIA